jgi:sugar-specific transcriptional regulator TrmB
MLEKIKHNLKELGLKNHEIEVYIALTQLGEATAAQVAKKTDLPRTTVISILNRLYEENYLTTHLYRGTTYYWIESPRTIATLLENKLQLANGLNDMLTKLYRTEAHFPFAKVYDTKTGIRKFIETLLCSLEKKSSIYTIDTPDAGNYQKIYSADASGTMIDIKNKRQIITNTLVPWQSFKKIDQYKIDRQNIIIREMPQGLTFNASLWLTKDVLVHFSGNPPFIIAVKHEIIVKSTRGIFDYLWSISKPKS